MRAGLLVTLAIIGWCAMPAAATAEILHICSDPSGVSCPEAAQIVPDTALQGSTYTDTIPDTLDLATWAQEYYHGTLALMVPSAVTKAAGARWVPDNSFVPGIYQLYHAITLPENGAPMRCGAAPGPCISASDVPQWAITLDSTRRAREMFGNAVASDDNARELASLRGVFAFDQNDSANKTAQAAGDINNTYGYTMMLLDDLYREYPSNGAIRAAMAEYERYFSALVSNDGVSWFWGNHLASDYKIGYDGRGGYHNNNFIRIHQEANIGSPLSHWYVLSGDWTGLDLGQKAAGYLMSYSGGTFWTNPDPARFTADAPVEFVGHVLAYGTAMEAILADAQARVQSNPNDPLARQEAAFVKQKFEFAMRRGGEGTLGNFGVSSYLGVMLQIAVGLEHLRAYYPDLISYSAYYEDAERWVRNQAAEDRVDATVAAYIPDTPNSDPQLDRIGSRAAGTFLSDATHVSSIPFNTFIDDNDGLWLMRGLADVWRSTVEITTTNGSKVAWINFLLNNASTYLDVYSDVPYRGRVVVRTRLNDGGLDQIAVRIPSWAGSAVTITEDIGAGPVMLAQGTRWGWSDRYAAINGAKAGATYTFTFPMTVQRQTVTQLYDQSEWWNEADYAGAGFPERPTSAGATFLGDTLVSFDAPLGQGGVPRYGRQSLASLAGASIAREVAPPQRTVTRFVLGGILAAPPANCTFNGSVVSSGSSLTAYQAASVPAGQQCLSQARTCTNGALSGSYTFASCTAAVPAPAPAPSSASSTPAVPHDSVTPSLLATPPSSSVPSTPAASPSVIPTSSPSAPSESDAGARIASLRAQLVALTATLAHLIGANAGSAESAPTRETDCPALARTLALGARGSDVRALQVFFTTQYYGFEPYVTGYFGSVTQTIVQQWQREHGIVSAGTPATTGYGVVGAKTRTAIAGACGA